MTNQNDAVRMLREALRKLLSVEYATRSIKFKAEVIIDEALRATANVQAEEVPAHPAQGDAELSDMAWEVAPFGLTTDKKKMEGWLLMGGKIMRQYCAVQSPASVDAQSDAELPKLPDYAATAWKSSKKGPARFSMLLASWFSPTATTEYLFTAAQMNEYAIGAVIAAQAAPKEGKS